MQQVTIEWLDLNGKKHTNKIAIPAGHINLSRIDDCWLFKKIEHKLENENFPDYEFEEKRV